MAFFFFFKYSGGGGALLREEKSRTALDTDLISSEIYGRGEPAKDTNLAAFSLSLSLYL